MQKEELELVMVCNGFEIRKRDEYSFPWVVFHEMFSGVFIDDFELLSDAWNFCKVEDADYWKAELSK